MKTERIITKLITEFNTDNPFEISFLLGFYTYYAELPEGTRGFSFNYDGKSFICINQDLDEPMKTLTCAHELGHLLLHKELNAFKNANNSLSLPSRYEKEADTFAAQLVLDKIDCYYDEQITTDYIAKVYGIPERIVKLKYNIE